jgi:hypothetical protein
MTAQATRTRSTVVYFLQTHHKPAQVARLVQVITEGSPDAVVLVSHDVAGSALDVAGLEALGNVHILLHEGGYGDFSHLEALATTDYDGFLLYSPVFPDRVPVSADQGAGPSYTPVRAVDAIMRHDYRHWRLGRPTPAKQRWLRPLMAINFVQPWIRLSNSYASVGVRRRRTVFGPGFHCYGGSFFCTLRAECARYVRDYARANPDVVAFFRTALAPEEAFLHSVLVNSGRFSLDPDYKRYIDWTGCTHTHPRTLGPEDLDRLLASDAHWARKLDLDRDPELFDILDQRVRRGSRTAI